MKFLSVIVVIAITACNNTNHASSISTNETAKIATKETASTNCYKYIKDKDTVDMLLIIKGEQVNGTLSYNYFEKDKNSATLVGTLRNDTLIAEYSFNSEGINSIREVIFVKKGDSWKEGHGEMEEIDSKLRFKKPRQIYFANSIQLNKINCAQVK